MSSAARLRSLTPWLALAAAWAAMLAWTWGTWPDVQIDFGREVYGAWRLAEGDALQRDVAWLQGPLSVHWNALVLRVFGGGLWVLFAANAALAVALSALLFLLLRSLFGALAGLVGALLFVLVFACAQLAGVGNYNFIAPYSHELTHGVALALASVALVAWHERDPRAWKPVGVAALAGAVALTKAEPALALGAALALVLLRSGPAAWKPRAAAACARAFLVAPLAMTLWLALELGIAGALEVLAAPYANLVRGEVGGLPFYRKLAGVDALGANLARMAWTAGGLALAALLATWVTHALPRHEGTSRAGARAATFAATVLLLYVLPIPWLELLVALPLACALALALAWRARSLGALALFAFALALTAKIALAVSARHYGFALAMPGTVACAAALVGARGRRPELRAVALAAVSVWCGAHLVECARWLAIKTVPVGSGRDAFLADGRGTYANRALELIRERTEGPLVVLPEGAMLNYLARRESPARVVNFLPPELALWGEAEVAAELERSRARHVLLWSRYLGEYGYEAFGEDFAPDIGRWLAGYRTVAAFGDPLLAVPGRRIELRETTRAIDNLVLVSIDTLRADRLGCYGAERALTPVLDELAAQGVLFERAYAAAPWTLPSHASMFTSEWPHATGVGSYDAPGRLVPEVVTLAERLRDADFETAGFTGGGYLSRAFGLGRGFDVFQGELERSSMREVLDQAGDWLDARQPGRGFFLFLHTWEVHQYEPPAAERERWVRPYAGPLAELDSLASYLQQDRWQQISEVLSDDDLRYARDRYDACVASVDAVLGRLFERLRADGLLERTLVVVTSDHGEELAEHGGTGHGYTLYEESVRVPLILAHASLDARRVAQPVSLVDLAPTLATLLGVAPPARWRGRDLLAEELAPGPCFLGAAHRPFVGAVEGQRKAILATHQSPAFEGHRLDADPAERDPQPPGPEDAHLLRALVDEYLVGEARGARVDATGRLAAELEALGYAGAGADEPERDAGLDAFRALARTLLEIAGGRR